MEQSIVKKNIRIGGMTCVQCENKIRQKLETAPGVLKVQVHYTQGIAQVSFDSSIITLSEIEALIQGLHYEIMADGSSSSSAKSSIVKAIATVAILLILLLAINYLGGLNFLNLFPTAQKGMGYGALFLIGLLTSLHCVGMCGGINVSQCVSNAKAPKTGQSKYGAIRPSALYNLGRVISYTIIGGIVGSIGSVISFSGMAKGIVSIIAGIFMVIMALNMWGLFPWLRRLNPHMPKIFARKINEQKQHGSSPFFIGLLNGLMPCGPLQAMQIFALSTGSPVQGALSMFFFSLGTVPLMFGLGAISSLLSQKFTKGVMMVSGALVLILGVFMFSNGMSLSGIGLPIFTNQNTAAAASVATNVQLVTTSLLPNEYTPITVKSNVPVKWTIEVTAENLNGCNNKILIPQYNIEKELVVGENIIEFTPATSGTVPYSCWMGMIKSQINIVN